MLAATFNYKPMFFPLLMEFRLRLHYFLPSRPPARLSELSGHVPSLGVSISPVLLVRIRLSSQTAFLSMAVEILPVQQ